MSDNNPHNKISLDLNQIDSTKNGKTISDEPKTPSTASTISSHSYNTTDKYTFNIFGHLIDIIREIFSILLTIIIIFVIAGLVTGNLKSWTKNVLYYGNATVHTIKNISFPHNYKKGTAEYTLSKYIDALFSGDQYTANQYINTEQSDIARSTDTITNTFRTARSNKIMNFLVNDMANANYKIVPSDTNSMTYSLVLTTYDYQVIVEQLTNETSQYEYQILLDDNSTQSDNDIALKALKYYVYKAPKNLKFSIDFKIEGETGSFKITDFEARQLVCAMTGNLILSIDENYTDTN